MLARKRPLLRQQQRQQQNPCSAAPRQGNPVSVVGGGATVGIGGANAGTPVSVGNQLNSQFQTWNWQPWWGWNYPVWGCNPYVWPYTCSPWGYPNYGYQGTPWPYGYPGYAYPYGY